MRTDKTLLEPIQISEGEILARMDLLELKAEDLETLAQNKPLIEENIDAIVEAFYEKQTQIDEVSILIGDAETLTRLSDAQRRYVIDLFAGNYDGEYVNNRLRIGMVHKRIGVEPRLYLSAILTMKRIIIRFLKQHIETESELNVILETLEKLIYFDTTLVFDAYIDSLVDEIENAKRETERYAKGLEKKVAERTAKLQKQATLDPLTNIYNQRVMQDCLRKEIALAKRRKTRLSLIYFDIDNFKEINDENGHSKGDEVLKYIGQVLLKNIRETDCACRCGGDEFCVILPECATADAKKACEKIIAHFSKKFPYYTLSIGISETGGENYIEGEALVKLADQKMYQAKKYNGFKIEC